jgi:plastocyanin
LKRFLFVLALSGLGMAGAAAPFAIPAIGDHSASSATITIKVRATEFKFALSKKSVAPGTTVIFKVTNKGQIPHDFKIAGKKTQVIKPGATKSVKVVFKKKGKLVYLCTVLGHAKLGMKGTFGVGVKPPPITTTTGGTTTSNTTTTGGGGFSCTTPTTTVNVGLFEYRFDPSTISVPAGCIQFVITNRGAEVHNFDIQGVKAGANLSPGQSETWAVQLGAGGKG